VLAFLTGDIDSARRILERVQRKLAALRGRFWPRASTRRQGARRTLSGLARRTLSGLARVAPALLRIVAAEPNTAALAPRARDLARFAAEM